MFTKSRKKAKPYIATNIKQTLFKVLSMVLITARLSDKKQEMPSWQQ